PTTALFRSVAAGVAAGGPVTITATDPSTSKSGTAQLTVTAAALVSIAVTPASPSIAKGLTQAFLATGTYTDSSTLDITTSVNWTSSNTGIATIGLNTGVATGVAVGGPVIITATDPSTSKSGTAQLTVTAATLVSIAVTPGNPSIAKGLTQAFTATGTYTDSSTLDLTNSATWNSSNGAVASIDASGVATG